MNNMNDRTWIEVIILLIVGVSIPICDSFVVQQHTSSYSSSQHHHHSYTSPSTSTIQCDLSNSNDSEEDEDTSPFDMDNLRKRMEKQASQYTRLLMEQSKYADNERTVPQSVHIILFHPNTPEQHVHTVEFPKNSGNNLILAFENDVDCVKFARMLQDMEFVNPSPEETVFEPFAQYAEMAGLSLMIVPKGFELTPPQINANDDDADEDDNGSDDDDVWSMRDNTINRLEANNDDLDAWG